MIAVDWGTSSLRLYRIDADGVILDRRRSDLGIMASQGRFAEVLLDAISGWDDALVVMGGMVGSRIGWHEMPYLPLPCGVADLAAGLRVIEHPLLAGRQVWIAPGLSSTDSSDIPDVMRGEELQVFGLPDALMQGRHQVCLPGTHCKWVRLEDGCIRAFVTTLAGEAYGVFSRHSILSATLDPHATAFSVAAFDQGIGRSGQAGGLLHHLFAVRTLGLFERSSPAELASYLSGLLIGHEIRDVAGLIGDNATPVQAVGSEVLRPRYLRAFQVLGIDALWHAEDCFLVGLRRVVAARGLSID